MRRSTRWRNPTLTTAGGTVRKVRVSTVQKRKRGLLRVDVVADGQFARLVFSYRNGDQVAWRAPSVPVAMSYLETFSPGELPCLGAVAVNGIELPGGVYSKAWDEIRDEYRGAYTPESDRRLWLDKSWFDGLVRTARNAWIDLGEDSATTIGLALEHALQHVANHRIDDRGWRDGHGIERLLDGVSAVTRGHGVEAIESDEGMAGPYWGSIVALYVNRGTDAYDPTILYETETGNFRHVAWGDWVEAYEAEGGTAR